MTAIGVIKNDCTKTTTRLSDSFIQRRRPAKRPPLPLRLATHLPAASWSTVVQCEAWRSGSVAPLTTIGVNRHADKPQIRNNVHYRYENASHPLFVGVRRTSSLKKMGKLQKYTCGKPEANGRRETAKRATAGRGAFRCIGCKPQGSQAPS